MKRNHQALTNLGFLTESYQGHVPMMLEVLDLFLEQVPEQLRELENAVHQASFAEIERIAHRMKSTLMIVGLTVLNEDLNEMELLGENGEQADRIPALFLKVREVCFNALDEIKQERTNLAGKQLK